MENKVVYNGNINDNFCITTIGYDDSCFKIFKVKSKEEGLKLHKEHKEDSLYSGVWGFISVSKVTEFLEWCKKPLNKQSIDLGFIIQK